MATGAPTTEHRPIFGTGGIKPDSDVRVSGLSVGRVSSVKLDGTKVLVSFTVDDDVALGNRELRLMVDSGLTDKLHQVGAEVDPTIYDQMKLAGQFQTIRQRSWRDANNRLTITEGGLMICQLIDPVTRSRIGTGVAIYVNRGTASVPSRVGVEFWHRLTGCQVLWDLDGQVWCVDYP